jgi:hypothetical protein
MQKRTPVLRVVQPGESPAAKLRDSLGYFFHSPTRRMRIQPQQRTRNNGEQNQDVSGNAASTFSSLAA